MDMEAMKMKWNEMMSSVHKMKDMVDKMSMEGMDEMKMEMDKIMENAQEMDEMMKKDWKGMGM